ncbi:type VII secretion-associated serine protease mycosin [Micromonospora sp. WMMD956]|uniref:type VII secretion-associated serine protease mycosin n=1 Tax=Micromonospora sp. WMMD956 TaxID=3016108 RepID=UPI0024176BD7|nr:type VII secretion-associated serine protease mycosin [Micromonospora sp. WMMD956]MDG4816887.1 type VII secretion-associated serine protease mycosin [Micromonospora sp. WMMD956]
MTGRAGLRRVAPPALAALLAAAVVPPAPASAAPTCGPIGNPAPTEAPWALTRLDPASAWRVTRGEGVTVAVVDSGVSATHPLLRGQVRPGRDFNALPSNAGQCDAAGHGTIVAGIIAGREGTGSPFTGIAPAARILPVRVLPDTRRTNDEGLPAQIGLAIRWAVDQGADVINLSLVTLPRPELAAAVEYALAKGVVVVAAAGNRQEQQQDLPAYPAAYPGVIAVAGVDAQGGHVGSSVSGDYVDIAAPGLDIIGPAPRGQGYLAEPQGGTSFAAAYVSGVAALVRAAHPDLTPDGVAYRLTRTADNPPDGHNAEVGYGVVNPYRAVTSVLGTRSDPPPGALAAPAPPRDPLGWQRAVAVWVAAVGAVLAGALLAVRPILARGRRRGWRPGRRPTTVES